MSRSADILRAAADALESGTDPFAGAFLREHEVTLDECYDLAGHLALGAQLLAWAIENPREAVAVAQGGTDRLKIEAITEALKRLNIPATEAGQ